MARISPVDMPQAAIGLGMQVCTRYSAIINPDGSKMTVREMLSLIQQVYDETLAEGDEEYDVETRWAVTWFAQHGYAGGPVGDAETLAIGRAISIGRLVRAGIVATRGGKVSLLPNPGMPTGWNPRDPVTVWIATLHLAAVLGEHGEEATAQWAASIGGPANHARALAERLYRLADGARAWRSPEQGQTPAVIARPFAALAESWSEIMRLVQAQNASVT